MLGSVDKETKIQTLKNGIGFIRKRKEPAVLRYFLSYDNDENLARGLLVLFLPFRDELKEMHQGDVVDLLSTNKDLIKLKRTRFEKYKMMNDLINQIQKENEKNRDLEDEEEELRDEETTNPDDIEDFNNWARNQALKELSKFKN